MPKKTIRHAKSDGDMARTHDLQRFPTKEVDMGNALPIWNLAMHSKKRYVNESLDSYTYRSPRARSQLAKTKLPTLRVTEARRTKSQWSIPAQKLCQSEDSPALIENLPPLKFHESVHSQPFPKRASDGRSRGVTARWSFQARDEKSPRFQNQTFRIFRPMLYSVLLTSKLKPHVRNPDDSTGSSDGGAMRSSSTLSEDSGGEEESDDEGRSV